VSAAEGEQVAAGPGLIQSREGQAVDGKSLPALDHAYQVLFAGAGVQHQMNVSGFQRLQNLPQLGQTLLLCGLTPGVSTISPSIS